VSAHVCVFHRGAAERDTLLADFFAAGAAARDKCLCIADTPDPAPVEGELRRVMGETAAEGQLTVLTTDAYLTDGRFEPDQCVAQWDTLLSGYVAEGFEGIRATADVAGLLGHGVGGPALLDYEARCNGLSHHPATIYCLYDLDRVGPGLVAGVLSRHTGAVAGGVLLSAPRAEAVLEPGARPWQAVDGSGQQSLALAQLLLAGAADEDEIRELVAQVCAASVDVDVAAVTGPGSEPPGPGGLATVRYPISHGGTVLGWLVAGSREPTDLDSAASFLSALAVLAGPHLGAARLAAAEFTRQLLDGEGDEAGMLERVRAFGVDPSGGARVAVVRLDGTAPAAVRATLADHGVRLATSRAGEVAFLAADAPELDDLLAAVAGEGGATGVGRATGGVDDVPRSYADARQAAALAAGRGRPVLRSDDLGLFRLLADRGDPHRMEELVEEWLGALAAHDRARARGGDLVATLAAYLDAGANQLATAEVLGIHVSTLKYRLRRIEEVSGWSLSDPDQRFHLQVALHVRRTLEVLSPQQ
jgi:hypothetical protein